MKVKIEHDLDLKAVVEEIGRHGTEFAIDFIKEIDDHMGDEAMANALFEYFKREKKEWEEYYAGSMDKNWTIAGR